jgi:hypothetical protein
LPSGARRKPFEEPTLTSARIPNDTDARPSGDLRTREEAGVREFSALTRDQRRAADRVYSLLSDLAAMPMPEGERPNSFWPRIDRVRHNHTVILDGGRGSGKTTVFLSLLDSWARYWREAPRDGLLQSDPGRPPPTREPYPARVASGKGVLVPLEIVDLQPLPPSMNLLLHLAGRLQRVVKAIEGMPAERWPAAFHPRGPDAEPASSTCWREFIQVVAGGWDGNVRERRAQLDPEAYAIELEQSARRGIEMQGSFQRFLDALTKDFCRYARFWLGDALPLFIVPIDDADMNPHRSMELIDLLQSLAHPRMAFLLTGHSDMFLSALRAHYLAMLRRPLARLRISDEELHALGLRASPTQLAEDVYARAIPPAHRCELPPLSPADRIGAEAPDRKLASAMQQALASIDVPQYLGAPARTLSGYFEANPQLKETLPDRLRGLQDLLAGIESEKREESDPRPAVSAPPAAPAPTAGALDTGVPGPIVVPPPSLSTRVVRRLWRDALRRSHAGPEQRELLSDVVERDEVTGQLAVFAEAIDWKTLVHDIRPVERYPWQLTFGRVARVQAHVKGHANDGLHEAATAALMLAIDVASDDPESYFVGPSPAAEAFHDVFARVEIQSTSLGSRVHSTWPLPRWESFRDHVEFSRAWVKFHINHPLATLEEIAATYLCLVLDVSQHAMSPHMPETKWAALAERIVSLAWPLQGSASRRDAVIARWALSHAGLLAAPESGLPPVPANELLKALQAAATGEGRAATLWPEMKHALLHERRRHMRQAWISSERDEGAGKRRGPRLGEERLRTLLEEMDGHEHDWATVIEDKAPKATEGKPAVSAIDLLLNARVTTSKESFLGPLQHSVEEYARGERFGALQKNSVINGKELSGALRELSAGGHPEAGQALLVTWRAITQSATRLQGIISKAEDGLRIEDLVVRDIEAYEKFSAKNAWTYRVNRLSLLLPKDWGRVQQAIYRIAWDVKADERDLRVPSSTSRAFSRWWDGIHIDIGTVRLPWLSIAWPALIDWETVTEAWNGITANLRSDKNLTEGIVQGSGQERIDRLAYQFIKLCLNVADERSAAVRWHEYPRFECVHLSDLVKDEIYRHREREESGHVKGSRWEAFKAWRAGVPLFAAPESGLSHEAAEAILDGSGISTKRTKADAARRAGLQKLRLERALYALGKDATTEQAKTFLADIDKDFPDHPWQKRIGA